MEKGWECYDAKIRGAKRNLAAQEMPDRLRNLCAVDGTGTTNVFLRSTADATDDELQYLAGLGYGLRIFVSKEIQTNENLNNSQLLDEETYRDAAEIFDLSVIAQALGRFRRLSVGGQSRYITGWNTLETAVMVEDLALVNPLVPVDLDRLPQLQSVSLQGWNAASALSNPGVTRISIDATRIPERFTIDHPVREMSLSVSTGEVDLDLLSDRSELVWLSVTGAATISLKPLVGAARLKALLLFSCKQVRDANVLTGLKELESIDFDNVRSIDSLSSLTELNVQRFMALRNYIFDDQFVTAVDTRPGWVIEKFRPPRGESRKPTLPSDDSPLPFLIRPHVGKAYQVVFDDWDAWAQKLESTAPFGYSLNVDLDQVVRAILERDDPASARDKRVYLDSEASAMHLVVADRPQATRIAKMLQTAWNDENRMSELIRSLS